MPREPYPQADNKK
jgi:hypothetical protein